MLAQNFKPAAELGFTEIEFRAAVTFLGMLERAEVRHERISDPLSDSCPDRPSGFNMRCIYGESPCGTTSCICGWIETLAGIPPRHLAQRTYFLSGSNLRKLFYQKTDSEISLGQAAVALRNYLTFGEPRWDEALAAS